MQEAKSGIPSSCQPHSEQMKGKQRETLVPQQQGVYDSRAHHDKSQNAPGVIFFVGGFFPKKQKFKILLELFPVQFVFPKNTAISITKCILKHGCGFLKLLN